MKLARSVARNFTKARSFSHGQAAGKHGRKRSGSSSPPPPARTRSAPEASPILSVPGAWGGMQRNAAQVRFFLTQRSSPAKAKASLEAIEAIDRRCDNDALFGSIGRARPQLLAPLHYFAHAQAEMASIRGVQAGMQLYQRRNQELLYRTAMHPKVVGLDGWLVHLCSEKLGVDGRIGPTHVDDVNRMFLELQQALHLCEELGPSERVNVACDNATYVTDPQIKRARSFDLDVRDGEGKVTRQIEVTSYARPVQHPRDLRKSLEHFVHKVCDALPGTQREGAIALNWDVCRPADGKRREVGPQPFELGVFLDIMVQKLEQQAGSADEDCFGSAGRLLDRITLFSRDPACPQVFAILTRDGVSWRAEIGPFRPDAA